MEYVDTVQEEKIYRGKIVIESKLDHEFYYYNTYAEIPAFDRIAAELYGLVYDNDAPLSGVVMTLESRVPVGVEVRINCIFTQLVINVTIVDDGSCTLKEGFEKYLVLTANKAMRKLVKNAKCKAIVEVGNKQLVVVKKD